MSRRLFVSRVDYAEIVLVAGFEDCIKVTAVQCKDLAHLLAFERPHQHFATIYARHNQSPKKPDRMLVVGQFDSGQAHRVVTLAFT
jgi:hypothetical protein